VSVHPQFKLLIDSWRESMSHRTVVEGIDGEPVEVCPACAGLERLADAPCPMCCPTTQDESDAAGADVAGV
jgi:hypothetical protein